MRYTKNLQLAKPSPDDFYDIAEFGNNMDILDEFYGTTMAKQEYDADNDGVVDNAKRLDGKTLSEITVDFEELLKNKANKSTISEHILESNSWIEESGKFKYNLEISEITSTNAIEVAPNGELSESEVTAFEEAKIYTANQSDGNLQLVAYGTKPEIDLPIVVIVRGDL